MARIRAVLRLTQNYYPLVSASLFGEDRVITNVPLRLTPARTTQFLARHSGGLLCWTSEQN